MTYNEEDVSVHEQELFDRYIVINYILKDILHVTNPEHIEPTPDKCEVDLYYTGNTGNQYVVEIKERNYMIANPNNKESNWMLETDKLKELKLRHTHKPLYFNIFQNNKVAIWQLENIDFESMKIRNEELRKSYCKETGTEPTPYYDLPADKAAIVTLPKSLDLKSIKMKIKNKEIITPYR